MPRDVKITADERVGEIVDSVPHAARVFEVVGVDACCHRDRSLQDAASAAKLRAEEVLDLLRRDAPMPEHRALADPRTTPLVELTGFISGHFHPRTRRMLVELTLLGGQAASAHGGTKEDIWVLQDHITRLVRELVPHMRREEQYLFPYIDSLEREVGPDQTFVVPLFGTVTYPLQQIHHDHAQDLALVAGVRELTHGFTPPDRACGPVRELYRLFAQFGGELEQHVRLENDVLFVRAVDEERRAVERARTT